MKITLKIQRALAKNNIILSLDNSINQEMIDFVNGKIGNVSSTRILKYRRPKTFKELYNLILECSKFGCTTTREKMRIMYGNNLGDKKYAELMSKHGVTEENMIKKYGEVLGKEKFRSYCEKQAYSNTKEYLGEEEYLRINKRKALTLENFILKYGAKEGEEKFLDHIQKARSPYSKISQKLFCELIECNIFKNNKCYFAEHNGEYGILDKKNNCYKKYDFVCPNLKLAIEFHGDHYHANPKIYNPNDTLKGKGQSKTLAKDAWLRDLHKENLLKEERGFSLITVWESDYKKDPQKVIDRILNYVKDNCIY